MNLEFHATTTKHLGCQALSTADAERLKEEAIFSSAPRTMRTGGLVTRFGVSVDKWDIFGTNSMGSRGSKQRRDEDARNISNAYLQCCQTHQRHSTTKVLMSYAFCK